MRGFCYMMTLRRLVDGFAKTVDRENSLDL